MPADLTACDKFMVHPSFSTEPGRPDSLPMKYHISLLIRKHMQASNIALFAVIMVYHHTQLHIG